MLLTPYFKTRKYSGYLCWILIYKYFMVYKCLNGIVLFEEDVSSDDARCYLIYHFTISDPSLKLETLVGLLPASTMPKARETPFLSFLCYIPMSSLMWWDSWVTSKGGEELVRRVKGPCVIPCTSKGSGWEKNSSMSRRVFFFFFFFYFQSEITRV